MEEDREQLTAKLQTLQARLQRIDAFPEMLAAVGALRQEQDEQQRLAQRLREQQAQLGRAQAQTQALAQAVRDAEGQDLRGGGEALLAHLAAEVEAAQEQFEHTLPREIDAHRGRLAELEGALADGPVSEEGLREGRANLAALQQRVRQLEAATVRTGSADTDDGLAMFRQQAALIGRKAEAVRARLEASASEREELERALVGRMGALEEVAPLQRSEALNTKSDDFKK
jgi:hypothetical protein